MAKTNISWTDYTFNPWKGCSKVSEGCKECFAEIQTTRYGLDLWGPTGKRERTQYWPKEVLKWNKEAERQGVIYLVFVASWADVFEGPETMRAEDWPNVQQWRAELWELIRQCPSLHFQMLTKRAHNIAGMLPEDWGTGYPNVWLGTSIEDNRVASRADDLRQIPATVRFISYEPAIGPLDQLDLTGIHWVIYGGESGTNHRPEDKQWARDMYARCRERQIPFFHKQSAGNRPETGIELDGRIVHEFPAIAKRN